MHAPLKELLKCPVAVNVLFIECITLVDILSNVGFIATKYGAENNENASFFRKLKLNNLNVHAWKG